MNACNALKSGFRLSGIIAYAHDHFMSYNRRRRTGTFELYNDLDTKVNETIKSSRVITPNGAIYVC